MQSRIRDVRRALGLTLADVAAKVSPPTTAQTIGRLETGTRTVSLIWLERIAAALGVDASELVVLPDSAEVPLIATIGGGEGAALPPGEAVRPPFAGADTIAVRVDAGLGDYRAGDMLWLERIGPDLIWRALNRDVLVPRSGGRFYFARLIGHDQGKLHLLPLSPGARQIIIGEPGWLGVATRLIRAL